MRHGSNRALLPCPSSLSVKRLRSAVRVDGSGRGGGGGDSAGGGGDTAGGGGGEVAGAATLPAPALAARLAVFAARLGAIGRFGTQAYAFTTWMSVR